MTLRGHIKNGHVELDEPASLPEGAEVHVHVVDTGDAEPTIWNKLLDLAGTAKGLPPDAAKNHDSYLYVSLDSERS